MVTGPTVDQQADWEVLRGKVSSGVRWGALDQGVQQVMRFAVVTVLMRLSSPSDFGLIAEAYVLSQLASLVSDVGMGASLVQREDLEPRHVRTAFTATLVTGMAMTAIVVALAPVVGAFFGEPRLVDVVRAMAVVFLFSAARETPFYLLRRALIFRPFVIASAVAIALAGLGGIGLAMAGAGVWALVAYSVGEVAVSTAAAHVLAMREGVWRPRLGFDRGAFRDLFGFGAAVVGTRLSTYGQVNLDSVLVGKVLGARSLGLYNLAHRIMLYPLLHVGDVVATVMFPALSSIQSELASMRRAYVKAVQAVLLICLPASIGVAAVAPVLVPLLFGQKWEGAVVTLQILCLNGPRLALNRVTGSVFQASGRPGWDLKIALAGLAASAVGLAAGLPFGVEGVAVGYTVSGYALMPVGIVLVSRVLELSMAELSRAIAPIGLAAALMTAVAGAAVAVLTTPDVLTLGAAVSAGAAAYLGVLGLRAPEILRMVVMNLGGQRR
jgi:PST family polysaccharide transporter